MRKICFGVYDASMSEDRLMPGDNVIAKITEEVSSDDIALIVIDLNCIMVRRITFEEENCILIPSNSDFKRQTVARRRVIVIGKVIFWSICF